VAMQMSKTVCTTLAPIFKAIGTKAIY